MKHSAHAGIFFAATLVLFACSKQVTRAPQSASPSPLYHQSAKPLDYVKKTKKDTLTYLVEFHDSLERIRFSKDFEKLLKSFPSQAPEDTAKAFFIKTQALMAVSPSSEFAQQPMQPPPAQRRDDPTVPEKTAAPEKTTVKYGGSAVIYSPFGSIDPALTPLVEAFTCTSESCPSGVQDSTVSGCAIKSVSDRKIAVSLGSGMQNAAGKALSAFDAVAIWSGHIKQHPAEGRALFRYVNGIDQFIAGREAVVPGFQVTDEKTVTLQLSQADPGAAQRLCTPRLFPAAFKTGPYVAKTDKTNVLQLTPNPRFYRGKPFLNTCEIKLGKDSNPFLAFSLNRYDVMELYSIKDIDYARRSFSDKAVLAEAAESRYFLSLALQSVDLRSALCKLFDRKEILANYVKAEGAPLTSIESTEPPPEAATLPTPPTLATIPGSLAGAPIVVLFRNDDPISAVIGDKLLADISRAGLTCTVKGVAADEYEKSLIKKDYAIAVGSVPGSILKDQSERLRMATMWFGDETNERARIDQKMELPLFSIKIYFLSKNKVCFLNNAIEGMYVRE
jgi:hypothetical protein